MTVEIFPDHWKSPEVFTKHGVKVELMCRTVNDLEITDMESCKSALNISTDVKDLLDEIEQAKKRLIGPHKQFINVINETVKEMCDKLEIAGELIINRLEEYQKVLETQEEMLQKLNIDSFETLDMAVELIATNGRQMPSTAKTIVTHKTEHDFKVSNKAIVPLEYLQVDEAKVKQAIKMGITHIPGITVTENKKLVLRRR